MKTKEEDNTDAKHEYFQKQTITNKIHAHYSSNFNQLKTVKHVKNNKKKNKSTRNIKLT